ncbi:MAG: beta-ketoacyl-[acyl-carrier-protein] synthase family protein, partial [Acidimicrobiia bacterium]
IPKREHRRMDRFTQYAMVATMEALAQAGGLDHVDPNRVTVGVATGIGGLASLEDLITEAYSDEPRPSPMLIPMMMCNAAAATISIHYGFGGQATTPVVACAAGGQAIMDTVRQIQWGYADAGIAGGAEGAVREPTIAGFRSAKALSPSMIARPFDAERDGFVLGEGAGILVLEERGTALARGATILAEILGAAATADAHHITAPHPGGDGAERAVRLALADAGIDASQVGYVNAHGTGTDLNDRTEGEVVARVWPEAQPAISSIKGTTGHALGASGAIEVVASVLAIDRAELPPNVGLGNQDPDIPLTDIVTAPRAWTPSAVISNSFGFGGHNTVVVVGPPH